MWLAALAAVMLAGCRGQRAQRVPRREAETRITVRETRIDHVPGQPLVMPVDVDGVIGTRPPRVLIDDGRQAPAALHWIGIRDGDGAWLPSPGEWTAVPASAGPRPRTPGSWCLMVNVPADAIGQGLWLGEARIALNWLADTPPEVPAGASSPWRPPADADAEPLEPFLEAERRSPLRRWRARLLTRGLAQESPEPDAEPAPDVFGNSVLESLAGQTEARWRIALARLWRADQDLADRVKRRLLASVDFGQGAVAPTWPVSQERLDVLLGDLLNPRLEDAERAERAASWLSDQPAAAAWVIDDAGTADGATGRPVLCAGVANLGDRTTLGWLETDPPGESPELVRIEPLKTAVLYGLAPPEPAAGAREGAPIPVTLHLGRWSAVQPAAPAALPVRPPGLKLEPFYADWRLEEWLAGRVEPLGVISGAWITSGMVFRDDNVSEGGGRWVVYLECRTAEMTASGPAGEEFVRIWIGAYRRPRYVIRVMSNGEASAGSKDVAGVLVTRREDRWLCTVPIPEDAIENDGAVRLSIERWDARGVRASWPRPMFPWQTEPGRVAVSTAAWGTLTAKP